MRKQLVGDPNQDSVLRICTERSGRIRKGNSDAGNGPELSFAEAVTLQRGFAKPAIYSDVQISPSSRGWRARRFCYL